VEEKMFRDEEEDTTIYEVVMNHEEQYSIWPAHREMPRGWKAVGKQGRKQECLAHIKEVWTDMRPLSLRQKMAELEARRPELEAEEARRIAEAERRPKDARDDLVGFLATGVHPVEAGLRPEKTIKRLQEAIGRGFVHIKFTDTRGGTELGFELDSKASDLSQADFESGTGRIHVEGGLTLNYQKVRCVADLDLSTLSGQGRLERVGDSV
jgi:uncharacterized protein YbdZ (MbtH family)